MTVSAFLALAESRFVSLTTYRKTGVAVTTPVWIARDGDALVVTTSAASGKVKRLRNSGRVQLQPCGRMGAVQPGSAVIPGVAEILGVDQNARITDIIRKKYGIEFHIVMAIERLSKNGRAARVMVRITAD